MKTNVALLVHACDRYKFLYPGFEYFFNKYWDDSIGCKLYFATEEETANLRGFKNIRSGKGAWADRLQTLLQNIPEQHVLYFQEDMWLTKPVNAGFFNRLFDAAHRGNWQQVKLHSAPVYKTIAGNDFIDGFNIARLDNRTSQFLMSHQVTLWNKDFLTAQLLPDEHPWRNERRATKRLKTLDPEIQHIDYFAENGWAEINRNKDPQRRSEYFAVSFNGMLHPHIQRFIPELQMTEPRYAAKLIEHFENKLTHDGLPRPKKEDIFKKLRLLIIGLLQKK